VNSIFNIIVSLRRLSIILCGVSLFLAALVRFFLPELASSVTGLLFLGLILLLLFLVGSLKRIKEILLSKKGWYGINTAVMIIVFIAIMVITNYLGATGHKRFDVTASGKFTLAPQTVNLITGLNSTVEIIGFFPDSPEYMDSREKALNLLEEYRYYNKLLSYRIVDPEVNPAMARQYRVKYNGTIVFVRGDKNKSVTAASEQDFTNALLEVNGIKAKKIYFLSGHSERDLNNKSSVGYSSAKTGLIRDLYRVASLNLAKTQKIPLDCAVMVIAGASKAFPPDEFKAIREYLLENGKLLILADPNPPAQIAALTSEWGLTILPGRIRDKKSFAPPDTSSPAVFRGNYPPLVITDGLDTTYFPGTAPVDLTAGLKRVLAAAKKDDDTPDWPLSAAQLENLTILPVLLTTKAGTLEKVNGKDKKGTNEGSVPGAHLAMGAMIVASKPLVVDEQVQDDTEKLTRIVVIGDSDFASNVHIQNGGNGDIFLNAINWLAEEEHLISIRPKQESFRRLLLGKTSARFVRFSSAGLLPFLVLVAGTVVWWRKR